MCCTISPYTSNIGLYLGSRTHPIAAQYPVIPFFPFGFSQAPPDCQSCAECVCHTALTTTEAASHVYIDDFQHLSKLLEQGREIFEIGAKVFEILGLVEKIVKREGPARVMTLLGFNSSTHILSIPEPKQVELLHLISQILDILKKRWVSAV